MSRAGVILALARDAAVAAGVESMRETVGHAHVPAPVAKKPAKKKAKKKAKR